MLRRGEAVEERIDAGDFFGGDAAFGVGGIEGDEADGGDFVVGGGGAFEEDAFEGGGEVFRFREADDAIVAVGGIARADDDDFAFAVVGGHGVAGDAEGEGGFDGGVGEVGCGDVIVGDAGRILEVAVLPGGTGGDPIEDGDVPNRDGIVLFRSGTDRFFWRLP